MRNNVKKFKYTVGVPEKASWVCFAFLGSGSSRFSHNPFSCNGVQPSAWSLKRSTRPIRAKIQINFKKKPTGHLFSTSFASCVMIVLVWGPEPLEGTPHSHTSRGHDKPCTSTKDLFFRCAKFSSRLPHPPRFARKFSPSLANKFLLYPPGWQKTCFLTKNIFLD